MLAIMVRYNLLNSGVVGPKMSFFLVRFGHFTHHFVTCFIILSLFPSHSSSFCQFSHHILHHFVTFPIIFSSQGVVAPWLVTMFCYQASVLVSICNWSALLTIGVVNLIAPIAVYREALLRYGDHLDPAASSCCFKGHRFYSNVDASGLTQPLTAGGGGAGSIINQPAADERGETSEAEAEAAVIMVAVPDWLARRFPGGAIGLAETMMSITAISSALIIILNIYGKRTQTRILHSNDEFGIKNDEFCINNHESQGSTRGLAWAPTAQRWEWPLFH